MTNVLGCDRDVLFLMGCDRDVLFLMGLDQINVSPHWPNGDFQVLMLSLRLPEMRDQTYHGSPLRLKASHLGNVLPDTMRITRINSCNMHGALLSSSSK
jgi:hypothetical protein